jgi:hypothetical protein
MSFFIKNFKPLSIHQQFFLFIANIVGLCAIYPFFKGYLPSDFVLSFLTANIAANIVVNFILKFNWKKPQE